MIFIDFDEKKCDECFKCLRTCPTKAISFDGHSRKIIDELCIKCGECQQVCPQKALKIHSDVLDIKHYINTTSRVAASLAPSFASAFSVDNPLKVVTALKQLGFDYVEETGVGADAVSKEYLKYLDNNNIKNVISTCCPSANYIVEKYYPGLINNLLPVVSPMIAHGKMIKENYGIDTKVVFIGPCLAKKAEALEFKNSVDGVLTFNELDKWLIEKNIYLEDLEASSFDNSCSNHGKVYPLGALSTCSEKKGYDYVKVDTYESCIEILNDLEKNKLDNLFIELNVCKGSCLNGPDFPNRDMSLYERQSMIKTYLKKNKNSENTNLKIECRGLTRSFSNKKIKDSPPEKKELIEILKIIDKYQDEDYLNCGACGYSTCLDKAEAYYYGYSDIYMCMPYLRSKAESLQNVIFENSPNVIFILNKDLEVQNYNPSFTKIFSNGSKNIKNSQIKEFIGSKLFEKTLLNKMNYTGVKERYENLNKVFITNSLFIESHEVVVVIMTDITANEKNKEDLKYVKENTLNICQEVIDKQMRVAQNIASILGETTAETKVNLNRLRDIVLKEDDGEID